MAHFHSHGNCSHEHIKLCPICGDVYCQDCGKEWEPKWYYPHYYGQPYIVTYGSYTLSRDGSVTVNQPDVQGSTTVESHKHE